MKLIDLVLNTQCLLEQIEQHPDYQALVAKDFTPDVTLGDAKTALTCLAWEVEPPAMQIDIISLEVVDHG